MAAMDSAFPASVPPIPPVSESCSLVMRAHALGDVRAEPVDSRRHAAGDGLPIVSTSGSRPWAAV